LSIGNHKSFHKLHKQFSLLDMIYKYILYELNCSFESNLLIARKLEFWRYYVKCRTHANAQKNILVKLSVEGWYIQIKKMNKFKILFLN